VTQPRRLALLLAFVTLALYLPTAWFDFVVYDDGLYVTENPIVQAGVTWAGLKYAFTTLAIANWHPLTLVSHMVDCGLFGLNPAGPHLENTLIHAVNAALLFVLLLRLTDKLWPAAFIAALFAWHPMHVESVAWISERKDVLSTFFALLAMVSYTNFVKQGCRRSYWISLLCFALGIMAKAMLVTLPCVLLLLDFWPLNRARLSLNEWRNWLKLLLEKIPYFLVTAGASLTTYHAQAGGSHGETAIATLELVPLDVRLGNLPLAIMSYVGKFFWPVQLVVYYPPPKILLIPMVAAATLTLLAITSFAWWQRKKRPYLLVGWFWFLGMLVPVSGLIQVGSACMADRYTYLPLVGIFIMVAFTTDEVAGRFAVARKIIPVVVIIILLACVGLTVKQIGFWKNSETLFRHDLAVVGDNEIALADLGVTL